MSLRIGQLAGITGETVKTIRYWTDSGLLAADRGENEYRYYRESMTERVSFIRSAQSLGFTIQEIAAILALRDRGAPPCADVQECLRAHLAAVRARIADLQSLEAELDGHLRWAEAHPRPQCETEGCVYVTVGDPPTAAARRVPDRSFAIGATSPRGRP